MQVIVITGHGGPEMLVVEERPSPAMTAGGVRIDVAAAGVNFADVMARMGLYPDSPDTPCVVGYEVCGTVTEVAEGVEGIVPGARVMAGTMFGGYASEVVVDAGAIIPLPHDLSFAQGAAVPVNYATAWAGLIGYGSLRPGDKVLIHAAAGGVGIAATQIAKDAGAEVWGTSSASKHEAIRGFGVDHPLDYRTDGWEKGLPPFDLIMDAVGGASARRSYSMLRAGGRLVAFGASSVVSGEKRNLLKAGPQALRMIRGFNLMDQMGDSKTIIGLNMLTLWKDRGSLADWTEPLQDLLATGVLKPVVHEEVPFSRAGDAHRILTERRNVGKVVLVP